MDFQLTPEQQAYRAKAREVALQFSTGASDRNKGLRFPMAESKILADAGLMGVSVPTEFGGSGLGAVEYALALHEVAGVCGSTAVTMAVTNMVGEMIVRFGTDEQKSRFLPRLTQGDNPVGSFCLSEAQSGSDAAALSARAVRDGDNYILNGTKMWVTSGAHCSVALVMARTGDHKSRGITAFLVDSSTPGYIAAKAEDKMGLKASNTAAITLEDCVVPAANILGNEGDGFKIAMTALDGGRVGIGAQALGIARSALTLAANAVAKTGPNAQAARFRLADAATLLDAGWLMMLRAGYLRAKGGHMTRQAAMAKVFATESAGKVVELAFETMGQDGLRADCDMERYMRDVRVTRIYEGTSEIQRLVIAREVLKGV